jgi:aromatic-L-amino-acid decarboxylase
MLHPEDFKKQADPVVSWIDHYLNHITEYPVKSQVAPGEIYRAIPEKAPELPEAMERIMEDLDKTIVPGITHWQHPGFHAYFPANSSVESVLAECITSAVGAQCMIWETSPAAAELEQRMAEWLRDAMGIPPGFEGVIQDSASSATLVALITAREVATGFRSNEEGVPGHLRIYGSTETHSSIEKAVAVCGIGKKNFVKVGTGNQLQMDPVLLEKSHPAGPGAGTETLCRGANPGYHRNPGRGPFERNLIHLQKAQDLAACGCRLCGNRLAAA